MSNTPMIYKAISDIMNETTVIGKNSKNQQQGFMYRGIDAVMNVFNPLLAKHHVFVVPQVLESTREERQTQRGGNLIYSVLKVKFTFYAEDGSFVEAIVQGEGMDSADKSSNKAMSVAYKYALFQTFCIPTEEMKDPDADSPEPSKPSKELRKTLAEPRSKSSDADLPFTMEYRCADCGKPFEPFTSKTGETWSAEQVFMMAVKKNPDGKARCKSCREKLEGGK